MVSIWAFPDERSLSASKQDTGHIAKGMHQPVLFDSSPSQACYCFPDRLAEIWTTSDATSDACIEVSSTSRDWDGLLDFTIRPEARRMFLRSDLLSFFRPWRVTGSNQIDALMAPPAPKKKAPEKTSQAGGCAVSYLFILE